MKTPLRAGLLALLTLWFGCADFEGAEQDFCTRNPGRCPLGIQVEVQLAPTLHASCVLLEVRNTASQDVLRQTCLSRADEPVLRAGILQAELPTDVEVAARPFVDCECRGTVLSHGIANGKGVALAASFPQGDTVAQPIVLKLDPEQDDDNDGYVNPGAGGEDCNDTITGAGVHPNQPEQCTDQADLNCDGRKGCESSVCAANSCIGPPSALALTLPETGILVGMCTAGSVQIKDAAGSTTAVESATTVVLAATPSAGGSFYLDSECTTSTRVLEIAAGSGSAPFFFLGRAPGTGTISATSTGLTMASQSVLIVAGTGNQLALTSPPRTAAAGACSQEVQVQSRDAQGNLAPVAEKTSITLSATPSTGFKFYSDSGCTAEAGDVTLTSGASSASFYFKGTVAGDVTITATATGFTGHSQVEKIVPGPAARIIVTGPASAQAGACSTQGTVTLQDAQGNPTTAAANTTISLAASGKPVTFSTSSNCASTVTSVVMASGTGSTSFFYRGTQAGASVISASSTGLTSGTLNVTFTPGPFSQLAFTTPVQTVAAGSCSSIVTVQTQDSFGNPSPVSANTVVSLTAGPSTGFQFFGAAACSGAGLTAVTLASGLTNVNFYFKGTVSGTVAVTASAASLSKSQTETINPGAPAVLTISPPAVSVPAASCSQATVQLQDVYGNPSPQAINDTVTLSASPSGSLFFSAAATCGTNVTSVTLPASQSSVVFYFKGGAGNYTVTAARSPFTSGTMSVSVN